MCAAVLFVLLLTFEDLTQQRVSTWLVFFVIVFLGFNGFPNLFRSDAAVAQTMLTTARAMAERIRDIDLGHTQITISEGQLCCVQPTHTIIFGQGAFERIVLWPSEELMMFSHLNLKPLDEEAALMLDGTGVVIRIPKRETKDEQEWNQVITLVRGLVRSGPDAPATST